MHVIHVTHQKLLGRSQKFGAGIDQWLTFKHLTVPFIPVRRTIHPSSPPPPHLICSNSIKLANCGVKVTMSLLNTADLSFSVFKFWHLKLIITFIL